MNNQLFWTGVVLLFIAAYCLAKTWFKPAGILATVGAVLLTVAILSVGVPAVLAGGGYVITTIAEMMGG